MSMSQPLLNLDFTVARCGLFKAYRSPILWLKNKEIAECSFFFWDYYILAWGKPMA